MSKNLSTTKPISPFLAPNKPAHRQSLSKNNIQRQLFQNPYLERLTHTKIAIPISIFSFLGFGLLFYAAIHPALSLVFLGIFFLAGILCLTLIEYLVHRYLFHLSTDTPAKADFQYKFHGVHHAHPKDEDRLAMPPIVSMSILGVILGIAYLIFGNYAYSFAGGFSIGYASYLVVHYVVHAFSPPNSFLRVLWINHSIHHYKNDEVAFGVSSPFWDWVFGTLPK